MKTATGRRGATQVDLEECVDASHLPQAARRLMESHYRAYKEYVPRAYPGRITLIRAGIQPLFGAHLPDLGWGELAGRGVEVHEVPANHLTFVREPHVQVLAKRLAAALVGRQSLFDG